LAVAKAASDPPAPRWLVLVYRIPSEPTRLRAGVWRRLKGLGSIYIQNSVAVLPASKGAERALRALRADIVEMGGSAVLLDAQSLAGENQLLDQYNAARDDEYEEIIDRCDDFLGQIEKEYAAAHFTYAELEENDVDLAKLRTWLERITQRDVLGAERRAETVEAVERCATALEEYAARVYAEESEESG
jgi:hypothetical protein